MFFLESFCIICALALVIAVLGMTVVYLLMGAFGLAGATCIGFAKAIEFLKRMVLGQKDGTCLSATESLAQTVFYIVVYIAILIWIANIS